MLVVTPSPADSSPGIVVYVYPLTDDTVAVVVYVVWLPVSVWMQAPDPYAFSHSHWTYDPESVHTMNALTSISVQGTAAGQMTRTTGRRDPLSVVPCQWLKLRLLYCTPDPAAVVCDDHALSRSSVYALVWPMKLLNCAFSSVPEPPLDLITVAKDQWLAS